MIVIFIISTDIFCKIFPLKLSSLRPSLPSLPSPPLTLKISVIFLSLFVSLWLKIVLKFQKKAERELKRALFLFFSPLHQRGGGRRERDWRGKWGGDREGERKKEKAREKKTTPNRGG